jgi:Tfp pilus assembly protein PilF
MDAIKRAQEVRLKKQIETHPLKTYGSLRQKKRIGGKAIGMMIVAGLSLFLVVFVWGPSPSSLLTSPQEPTTLPAAKPYLPDDAIDPKKSQELPEGKFDLSTPQPSGRDLSLPQDFGEPLDANLARRASRVTQTEELKALRKPDPLPPSLKTQRRSDEPVQLPQMEKTPSMVNPPIDKSIEKPPPKQALSPLPPEPAPQKPSPRQKEEVFSQSIPIAPERGKSSAPASDVLIQFNLGVQFYQQREISKAIQAYRKVIESDPTYIEAYNNLGIIYQEIGDYNNALRAYQTSIGINPRYEKALNNLGVLLYLMERSEESMEAFQKALAINANNVESHINLGILYKKQGQMDQAIACYRKVLTINPAHGEAHYNMGLLHEQLENVEGAISHYQKFIQLSKKTHPELVAKVQRHLSYLMSAKEKNNSNQ